MKLGAAGLGWVVVALAAFGLHPALREGTPLASIGRQIAEDAAHGGALLKAAGLPGSNVTFAFWALVASLTYLAIFGLVWLCPRRHRAEALQHGLQGEGGLLLAAAILGQVAASLFARDATGFYFIVGGAAALALRRPQPEPGLGPARVFPAVGLGLALVLLGSIADAGMARLTGAALLPEAWFPLAVEFSSRPVMGGLLALAIVASAVALTVVRIPWIALAPACILILGPSNPVKGLAAAGVIALLARAGAGPLVRASFLTLSVAIMVALALAL